MLVLTEATAKPNVVSIRSKAGPPIFGRTWPARSYPAECEALNHHAFARQGRGIKPAGPNLGVQIFATALKPEPGAAVTLERFERGAGCFPPHSTVLALRSSSWPLAAWLQS